MANFSINSVLIIAFMVILANVQHSFVYAQEDDHSGHNHASHSHAGHNHAENHEDKLSPALVWVAAMTTQLIMTVLASLGILLVPLLASRPNLNRHVMTGLIAMAAGTLLGDAIIHLIPHAMVPDELLHLDDMLQQMNGQPPSVTVTATEPPRPGCTLHGDHWHCNDGQTFVVGASMNMANPLSPEVILNQLQGSTISHSSLITTTFLVVLGAYLFYLVELFMHSRGHHHDHSHDIGLKLDQDSAKTANQRLSQDSYETEYHNGINMAESEFDANKVKPVAWLILVGDSLHNFFDGLAVGVSFASSWSLGMSTALAVLLHELPHELGDYAVMVESGIPKYRAILYNMASNLTAFVGAAVGIAVYSTMSEVGQRYVLAMTAGGFIYIALTDLVPLLFSITFKTCSARTHGVGHHLDSDTQDQGVLSPIVPVPVNPCHVNADAVEPLSSKHVQHVPYSLIIAQNIGFFIGVGFMVYVAVFHDKH